MYHLNSSEVVAIGAGKHLKATGMIKKVFLTSLDPYGFLLLLTPLELRGQEASFFCCDVKAPADERHHLRVGMQLEFNIIDKPVDNMRSFVGYKAVELSPLTPSLYQAAVIRAPNEKSNLLRVAIDLTLEQVNITPASYSSLKLDNNLGMGDPCVVQLTWKEMVSATKERRPLVGDIVSACRLPLAAGCSEEEEAGTAALDEVATNEVSQSGNVEHGCRGRRSTPKKVKQPSIRSKPPMPTTPKLISTLEAENHCNNLKQDPRCRSKPCCQSFPTQKMPPFPVPAFTAPCPCTGCSIMRQKYAMLAPGCLSCYPMDVGARGSWTNVDNC